MPLPIPSPFIVIAHGIRNNPFLPLIDAPCTSLRKKTGLFRLLPWFHIVIAETRVSWCRRVAAQHGTANLTFVLKGNSPRARGQQSCALHHQTKPQAHRHQPWALKQFQLGVVRA